MNSDQIIFVSQRQNNIIIDDQDIPLFQTVINDQNDKQEQKQKSEQQQDQKATQIQYQNNIQNNQVLQQSQTSDNTNQVQQEKRKACSKGLFSNCKQKKQQTQDTSNQTHILQQQQIQENQSQQLQEQENKIEQNPVIQQRILIDVPLIVFDLDETLIHTSFDFTNKTKNIIKLPIKQETQQYQTDFENNDYIPTYIAVRPHTYELIKYILSKGFQIGLWSASPKTYVDCCLDWLDNQLDNILKKNLSFIKYKQFCTIDNFKPIKDLDKLDYNLNKVRLIDDKYDSCKYQPDNLIKVKEFDFNDDDKEFIRIRNIIEDFAQQFEEKEQQQIEQ